MKAIILAAGRGSRMKEGTANLPKCMMKLWGKTLLDHCLESLQKAGFALGDIGIVTGYKSEAIQAHGVHYFHNAEWETTNMFVSLTKAAEWLHREPCVISYSDIVFSPAAVKKLMQSDQEFSITYYTGFWDLWSKRFDDPLNDLETFKMQNKRLFEIGKKPSVKEEVQGQYMGLLKFEPSGWKKIEQAIKLPMPKSVEKLDMTTLLQHLITLGNYIETIETTEQWFECDNQNDIDVYEKFYIRDF
ncbi:MAG: phosphocholine cytidylyltransferase family protein [Spirochaetes bacterium]|nr:phosphocholine cytidylyltransferase family protein [Spirochaetota bacterium]